MAKTKKKTATKTKPRNKRPAKRSTASTSQTRYPRHSLTEALRIPKVILDQNAGKICSEDQTARFLGLKSVNGPTSVEISSGLKFGFMERPEPKKLNVSDLGRQVLKPKSSDDVMKGHQQAILNAPVISDVYKHYRGENLPDSQFFDNALEEIFKIPTEKLKGFKDIFLSSLRAASLIEEHDGRIRVLYVATSGAENDEESEEYIDKLSTGVAVEFGDSCFVMMPFASPIGDYYSSIYKPAIEKAKLEPVRADSEIFGAGKIMDQVWTGINAAKVLVAELTTKNANVFYELGLAHALQKPVVLVSSNEDDVPFDLKHRRVIYYDKDDPFLGKAP